MGPQTEISTPDKPVSHQTFTEESKDRETGRLAHVVINSFYGAMLTDQQRVARFNDLRAFQLLLESDWNEDEAAQLDRFL